MEPTEGITQSQMDELKDAFKLFDKNGDENISTLELGSVLRCLGQNPTEETVHGVMAKADKDGNWYIEYTEYVDLLQQHLKDPVVVEIELREAFRVFDKDRSGSLNFLELQRAVTHLGDPLSTKEAITLKKMMDADGNDSVDVDEFVKFMCKKY